MTHPRAERTPAAPVGVTGPVLEVRNLRVHIGTPRGVVRAVEDVTFQVQGGEWLGIVGESGCGKTTLLRAVMGLLPPTARIVDGEIRFQGADLLGLNRAEFREVRGRSVGIVFQEPMTALNPVMKVGDQIAEAPHRRMGNSRRRARQRALDLMIQVGIPDPVRRYEAYPHELSGGMRQRILIAIALSSEPKLLLCDEPTTALDVTIQDQILKLLTAISVQMGLSVVYVTHDLAVVAQTCNRLAVMYAGQLVETGAVDTVFRRPRHPYTLGLLRSVPDFHRVQASLTPIAGAPPDLVSPPSGCPFHPRCPFVQHDCVDGAFPLRLLDHGQSTACIHHHLLRQVPLDTGVGGDD